MSRSSLFRFFHVLSFVSILTATCSSPLHLQSGVSLAINSSSVGNSFELVMEAKGQLASQFEIFSEALSPNQGVHKLTLDKTALQISPEINE